MNASYYSGAPGVIGSNATTLTTQGHPGQTWGWAVQGGVRLLNVFGIAKDRFEIAGAYCQGASGYCVSTPVSFLFGSGNSVGGGFTTDGDQR